MAWAPPTEARRWSAAWFARAAIFVFAVYFTVLDAIGGIGLGRTIVIVESLKLDDKQLDVVKMLLNKMWTDPLVGGVGSFVSLTASWAAFAASVLVAAALLLSRRADWLNMAVLVGFGWELQTAMPHRMARSPSPCSSSLPAGCGGPDGGAIGTPSNRPKAQSKTPRSRSASMMTSTSRSTVISAVRM